MNNFSIRLLKAWCHKRVGEFICIDGIPYITIENTQNGVIVIPIDSVNLNCSIQSLVDLQKISSEIPNDTTCLILDRQTYVQKFSLQFQKLSMFFDINW